jgi:hypothetical protein
VITEKSIQRFLPRHPFALDCNDAQSWISHGRRPPEILSLGKRRKGQGEEA